MKLLFAKDRLGKLAPVDEAGEAALRGLSAGEIVSVEIKRPRNVQMHRLYWALVTLVWQNQERYPTPEDLHSALKVAAGLRTQVTLPDGTVGFIPGSIAFHKMDQAEFSAFYSRVCDLMAKYFLPGVTSEELRAEVSQMTGIAA